MKKIALCGTPEFVCRFFEAIYNSADYHVMFVITQCAKKKDRGHVVTKSPVAQWAEYHGIECIEIDSISNGMTYDRAMLEERLSELECVLLFAFGKLIPSSWLSLPKMGWLNIHPSKLPLLRGPSPIQYSILYRLQESAITLMKMDVGMDTGDIIAQLDFSISEHHTRTSLLAEICSFGPDWITNIMLQYLEHRVIAQQQIGEASYSRLIAKGDHIVGEDDTIETVCLKIKALGYVYFPKLELKCFACRRADENSRFVIKLSDGLIEPIYIQKPGKRMMHIHHFLLGMR